MAKRGSMRNSVLDWWQTVLDETKELVDDGTFVDLLQQPADPGDDAPSRSAPPEPAA